MARNAAPVASNDDANRNSLRRNVRARVNLMVFPGIGKARKSEESEKGKVGERDEISCM